MNAPQLPWHGAIPAVTNLPPARPQQMLEPLQTVSAKDPKPLGVPLKLFLKGGWAGVPCGTGVLQMPCGQGRKMHTSLR